MKQPQAPVRFLTLAAAIVGLPLTALAGPELDYAYAPTPYTLAAACDLAQPLAFVNVSVRNRGDDPSHPHTLQATDDTGVLDGLQFLAPLAPGASLALQLPLSHVASSPGAIAGTHLIAIKPGEHQLKRLALSIPASFCAPAAAAPAPASAPAAASTVVSPASGAAMRVREHEPPFPSATANPYDTRSTTERAIPLKASDPYVSKNISVEGKRATLQSVFNLATPRSVKSVSGGADCAIHVGVVGALICPDMIKSGDLLLSWEWQPGTGPVAIDGYKIYRVDSGLKRLVSTQANKSMITLADLAKPADGYNGKCYAVTAFIASRESLPSAAYCAAGGSVATTVRLASNYTRSSFNQNISSSLTPSIPDASIETVGFSYVAYQGAYFSRDSFANVVYRTAVAFDVTALLHKNLVSATLHMTLRSSGGAGNNHSCATDVGYGSEFWWQNQSWIDGSFGLNIAPTDTGPQISADVTPIVASWLPGEPNYGFVLKNSDENLNAFTTKSCLTTYTQPMLEITYY